MDEEASDEKEKQIPEGFCQTLESETGWVDLEGVAAAPPISLDNIHHYFVMKRLWRNDVTASKPFEKGYKRYQIYHAQKVQNVAVHRGDTDSFYDIRVRRAAVMPSQRQDREYKTAIHRSLQNRSSLEAVLVMAATTFHGNSVGIGDVADFTPPEKCKLQTHVCSLIVIGLFMDTSHRCCKDGSFGRASNDKCLQSSLSLQLVQPGILQFFGMALLLLTQKADYNESTHCMYNITIQIGS